MAARGYAFRKVHVAGLHDRRDAEKAETRRLCQRLAEHLATTMRWR